MYAAENHHLILLERLGRKYELEIDGDHGRFLINVSIKGVAKPIIVRIYFNLIYNKYVQLKDYVITDSTAKIGEARKEKLEEELSGKLFGDDFLFAPLEHDFGYVYGIHTLFKKSHFRENRRCGAVLFKLDFSSFEPLVNVKSKHGHGDVIQYYYDAEHNWLLARKVNCDAEEHLSSGDMDGLFRSSFKPFQDTDVKVMDQHNHFYHVYSVPDPNNIRIFESTYIRTDIETIIDLYKKDVKLYTYRELTETSKYSSFNDELPFHDQLPIAVENIEVLSVRAVGEAQADFAVGTWVQLERGQIGRIASKRIANMYKICHEGSYRPTGTYYSSQERLLHNEIIPVEDPTIQRNNELVQFKIDYSGFFGYGKLLSETPRYFMIKPISKYDSSLGFTFLSERFPELRHSESKPQVAIDTQNELKELHGEDLNFVFVRKEHVSFLSDEETLSLNDYLTGKPHEAEPVFESLLRLGDINSVSFDYFVHQLTNLMTKYSLGNLSTAIAEVLVNKHHNNQQHEELRNMIMLKKDSNYVQETSR